jgi:hypothetical protein
MKKSERALLSENLAKALEPPKKRAGLAINFSEPEEDEIHASARSTQQIAAQIPITPTKSTHATPGRSATSGRSVTPGSSSTSGKPGPRLPPSTVETPGTTNIAPARDFSRVANSIVRDAMPAGYFSGKGKQVYDFLYSRTRAAIEPRRSVRLTIPALMQGADIGSHHTLRRNLRHLTEVGLVEIREITGEHEGNEYTVFLPEEVSLPHLETPGTPGRSATSVRSGIDPCQVWQKLPVLPLAETARPDRGINPVDVSNYEPPKTSFKTKERNDDDEAFAGLLETFKQAAKEITGKAPQANESQRWNELAELMVTELRIASARTTVSSVPSFLTEHLRRRLWKREKEQVMEPGDPAEVSAARTLTSEQVKGCPDCGGTGFYYPKGFEGGVARCKHEQITEEK